MNTLPSYGIEPVMFPKNITYLQQPLDLTTNASFENYEKRASSKCFMSCIMEALANDPDWDVKVINVDLRLSTLKPRQHLKPEKRSSRQDGGQRVSQIS